MRKYLSRIDDWFKGRWNKVRTKLKFELKKKKKANGFNNVINLKLKRYKSRVKQERQNKTFKNNQKALYEELDGKMRQEQRMPNAEESIKFWSELWDNPVDHDRNPE